MHTPDRVLPDLGAKYVQARRVFRSPMPKAEKLPEVTETPAPTPRIVVALSAVAAVASLTFTALLFL